MEAVFKQATRMLLHTMSRERPHPSKRPRPNPDLASVHEAGPNEALSSENELLRKQLAAANETIQEQNLLIQGWSKAFTKAANMVENAVADNKAFQEQIAKQKEENINLVHNLQHALLLLTNSIEMLQALHARPRQ